MKISVRKPKLNPRNFSAFFIRIGSNTLIQIIVLFVVLIGINIISQSFFFRIDLTENKIFSLSEGTRNIITNLDEGVTLEIYFSDNIPPDLLPIRQWVIDTYEEYERYSNGNVQLVVKNPSDENFSSDATSAGVPEVQYQEYSQDKYEIAKGFLGTAIKYKEDSEAIQLITDQNIQNLEYETTSRIYKMTNKEKPKIAFLTGHEEKSIDTDYTQIKSNLETQFTVESLSLENGKPINPEEIKVLVVAAPTSKLSNRDRFELDQYIIKGGRVIFLTDQYEMGMQEPVLNKTEGNLANFIKNYGVEVNDAVILDESYLPLQYIFTYPFWVLTRSENHNTDNPALSQIDSLVFFWSNPLTESEEADGNTITPLIRTTDKAWLKGGDTVLIDPSQQFFPTNQEKYNIAYLIEGKQESIFKGKDIPELKDKDQKDERTKEDKRVNEIEDTKIIVIGDSDFISDDLFSGSEQNPIFFQNIVEWFASSEDLISIRSKNISLRALDVTSDSQKNFSKVMNVAAVPIAIIVLGIVYNSIRKRKKSQI